MSPEARKPGVLIAVEGLDGLGAPVQDRLTGDDDGADSHARQSSRRLERRARALAFGGFEGRVWRDISDERGDGDERVRQHR